MRADIKNTLRPALDGYRSHVRPWVAPIDARIGTYSYGNPAGLHRNVTADLVEWKCRLQSDVDVDRPAPGSLAARLREFGYAHLDDPYDDGLVEGIAERFDQLIEDTGHRRSTDVIQQSGDDEYIHGLDSPLAAIPEIADLVNDEVRSSLEQYYQAYFQVRFVRAYRTYHIPPEVVERSEIHNEYWHYDGKSPDHVKLFVILGETTEEDGPLHVMPRPDTAEILRSVKRFDRRAHGKPGGLVDRIGEAVKLTGPPGTAMFGNTQSCLHRAGIPAEGRSRDIIQFYFAPASEPWPEDWGEEDIPYALFGGGLRRLLKY